MAIKYLTTVLASVLLAAMIALGVSAATPTVSEAASGGYAPKCGGGKVFLTSQEKRSFILHNRVRRSHNLRAFCINPRLEKAARAHSRDMIQRDYFTHNTKGGSSFAQRLKHFGYTPNGYRYYTIGENIAWGSGSYGTPDHIFNGWMHSTEHRHNILNGKFHEIGIGAYTGTYKRYRNATMYTADFGTRR